MAKDEGKGNLPAPMRTLQQQIKQKELENEILQAALGIPRDDKDRLFVFMQTHKSNYPIRLMCRLLGLSESAYYRRCKPRKLRKYEEIEIVNYQYDYTYDILPEGGNGTYFTHNILIGSTLFYNKVEMPTRLNQSSSKFKTPEY